MAYSTNPHLPKARAFAMQLLVIEQLLLQTVANRCGVHRTPITQGVTLASVNSGGAG